MKNLLNNIKYRFLMFKEYYISKNRVELREAKNRADKRFREALIKNEIRKLKQQVEAYKDITKSLIEYKQKSYTVIMQNTITREITKELESLENLDRVIYKKLTEQSWIK